MPEGNTQIIQLEPIEQGVSTENLAMEYLKIKANASCLGGEANVEKLPEGFKVIVKYDIIKDYSVGKPTEPSFEKSINGLLQKDKNIFSEKEATLDNDYDDKNLTFTVKCDSAKLIESARKHDRQFYNLAVSYAQKKQSGMAVE